MEKGEGKAEGEGGRQKWSPWPFPLGLQPLPSPFAFRVAFSLLPFAFSLGRAPRAIPSLDPTPPPQAISGRRMDLSGFLPTSASRPTGGRWRSGGGGCFLG